MNGRNRKIGWVLGIMGAVMASTGPLQGADPKTPVPEEEISLKGIKSYFDAALLEAEFDKDGDLRIVDEGIKTYVALDEERQCITFFSAWELRASAPELKKLQMVNTLNDELILVRFCMPDEATLWCDYQFLYKGGISPYHIVQHYRLFHRVVKGAVTTRDPDNLIGSE